MADGTVGVRLDPDIMSCHVVSYRVVLYRVVSLHALFGLHKCQSYLLYSENVSKDVVVAAVVQALVDKADLHVAGGTEDAAEPDGVGGGPAQLVLPKRFVVELVTGVAPSREVELEVPHVHLDALPGAETLVELLDRRAPPANKHKPLEIAQNAAFDQRSRRRHRRRLSERGGAFLGLTVVLPLKVDHVEPRIVAREPVLLGPLVHDHHLQLLEVLVEVDAKEKLLVVLRVDEALEPLAAGELHVVAAVVEADLHRPAVVVAPAVAYVAREQAGIAGNRVLGRKHLLQVHRILPRTVDQPDLLQINQLPVQTSLPVVAHVLLDLRVEIDVLCNAEPFQRERLDLVEPLELRELKHRIVVHVSAVAHALAYKRHLLDFVADLYVKIVLVFQTPRTRNQLNVHVIQVFALLKQLLERDIPFSVIGLLLVLQIAQNLHPLHAFQLLEVVQEWLDVLPFHLDAAEKVKVD